MGFLSFGTAEKHDSADLEHSSNREKEYGQLPDAIPQSDGTETCEDESTGDGKEANCAAGSGGLAAEAVEGGFGGVESGGANR